MRHVLQREVRHEVLSFITDITYANVPAWYGATRRDLKMDLICPKIREGRKGLPLIVWLCGGAYRMVDKSVWMPEFVYYARRGFVVASVEYRTANEVSYPAPLEDVKAAIRYLRAHAEEFCIDPDRIAVMGESAGATLANLAGVWSGTNEYDKGDYLGEKSDVQAVVDYYGGTEINWPAEDLTGFATDDVPPWTFRDFLGYSAGPETAKTASAVDHISENTPPFMIFLGSEDPLGSEDMNLEFCAKLDEYGIMNEYYYIEGAGHGDDAFYQDRVKDLIIEWLQNVM